MDYDYEQLATDEHRLIEMLKSRMEWSEDQAKNFIGSKAPGYGVAGAVRMIRLQDETEQAARRARASLEQQVAAAYG